MSDVNAWEKLQTVLAMACNVTSSRGRTQKIAINDLRVALNLYGRSTLDADIRGAISAAPELLEALEGVADFLERHFAPDRDGWRDDEAMRLEHKSRKAIAKARGRG